MSVSIYRLYAVQKFGDEQVAVYVNSGNWPDQEILSDASEIADGSRKRGDVIRNKPWIYGSGKNYTLNAGYTLRRDQLTYWTRLFRRAMDVVEAYDNVDKAIFVPSSEKKTWRGINTLYHNKYFDEIKSDTPTYSGCEPIGEIVV